MVNRARINSAQSIFFLNITRHQAISSVSKFDQVLGRGLMIQQVILIFIKCVSANQNRLFYMKVLYEKYICFFFYIFEWDIKQYTVHQQFMSGSFEQSYYHFFNSTKRILNQCIRNHSF